MTILAIDHGTRRIGLAIEGPLGFPMPLPVIRVGEGEDPLGAAVIDRLVEIVRGRDVTEVVVGLPIHLGGVDNPSARRSEELARKLEAALGPGVPVLRHDEGLTSWEAESEMRARGERRYDKGRIDTMAARIILRDFLAARHGHPVGPTEAEEGPQPVHPGKEQRRARREKSQRGRDEREGAREASEPATRPRKRGGPEDEKRPRERG